MSDDVSEYREIFLSESAEFLQAITEGLLALERQPDDFEPVETIFRGAHSLKGMASAMGYRSTAELTHRMEALMEAVRRRERVADQALIDLMLRATDTTRDFIIAESAGDPVPDATELFEELTPSAPEGASDAESFVVADRGGTGGALYRVHVTLEDTCVLKSVRAYMVLKRLGHVGAVVGTHPSAREIEDEQFDLSFDVIVRSTLDTGSVRTAALGVTEVGEVEVETLEEASEAPPTAHVSPDASAARKMPPKLTDTQTVRISIAHLDSMVDLVGELVVLRSRLEDIARDLDRQELREALSALEKVSTELQHEVMHTRMVPVGNIFNRFPRMVRDLARDLGKTVVLELEGLDIELDRTVLDEIGDPVVHLLRNCVDHGVEMPEERRAAGKRERGMVKLSAEREREQVRITVSDDGAGLDRGRILAKAVERGLIEASARDSLSDQDVFMLICSPGFTTAEQATKISGRGVGLDVVKGKIEYLGGTISIKSSPGVGTSISLMLPLTLAIIQALLVAAGDRIFAVPLGAVDEVVAASEIGVKTIEGRPAAVLRDGEAVSLHRLDALFGADPSGNHTPAEGDHVVLMRAAEHVHALAVSRLIGRQEIVVKPLSRMFRGIRGLGGAAVLGDGRVALILDPRTLFEKES